MTRKFIIHDCKNQLVQPLRRITTFVEYLQWASSSMDSTNPTPIYISNDLICKAAKFGFLSMLQHIYEKIGRDIFFDNDWEFVSKKAAIYHHLSILQWLSTTMPDLLDVVQRDCNYLPIHWAAEKNFADGFCLLAERKPEQLLQKNSCGQTPVQLACCYGSVSVLQKVCNNKEWIKLIVPEQDFQRVVSSGDLECILWFRRMFGKEVCPWQSQHIMDALRAKSVALFLILLEEFPVRSMEGKNELTIRLIESNWRNGLSIWLRGYLNEKEKEELSMEVLIAMLFQDNCCITRCMTEHVPKKKLVKLFSQPHIHHDCNKYKFFHVLQQCPDLWAKVPKVSKEIMRGYFPCNKLSKEVEKEAKQSYESTQLYFLREKIQADMDLKHSEPNFAGVIDDVLQALL